MAANNSFQRTDVLGADPVKRLFGYSPILYWLGAVLLCLAFVASAIFDDRTRVSPEPRSEINLAVSGAADRIEKLAKSDPDALAGILRQAFGTRLTPHAARELIAEAAQRQLPLPPKIVFVPTEVLDGATGAYATESGGTILLDTRLRTEPEALMNVFIHEWGHHLDATLGPGDAPGEEGQIFLAGVNNGVPPSRSPDWFNNDVATIVYEGRTIGVELCAWYRIDCHVKSVVKKTIEVGSTLVNGAVKIGEAAVNGAIAYVQTGIKAVEAGVQLVAAGAAAITGDTALAGSLLNGAVDSLGDAAQNALDHVSTAGNIYNTAMATLDKAGKSLPLPLPLGTIGDFVVGFSPAAPFVAAATGIADVNSAIKNCGDVWGAMAFAAVDVGLSSIGRGTKGKKLIFGPPKKPGKLKQLGNWFDETPVGKFKTKVNNTPLAKARDWEAALVANKIDPKYWKYMDYLNYANTVARPKDFIPGRDRDADGNLLGTGQSLWERHTSDLGSGHFGVGNKKKASDKKSTACKGDENQGDSAIVGNDARAGVGQPDGSPEDGMPSELEGNPAPEEEFGTTGEIIDGDTTPVTTAELYLPYCGDDAIIRDPSCPADGSPEDGIPSELEGDPDPEEEFGITGEIIDGGKTPVTTADLYLTYCGDDALFRDPNCPQDLVLFPESLPDGFVGSPYNTAFLRAEGGVPPLLGFAYLGREEPLDLDEFVPGLKLTGLNGSDGNLFRIDGVPTIAGDFPITFGVGEDTGTGEKKEYTLRIRPPGLSLSPASMPDGAVGVAYGPVTFDVKGGSPPYLSFLAGKSANSADNEYQAIETLIPGLTVTRTGASNTHQFTLAGLPTVAGDFEAVFGTADEAQQNVKRVYAFRIDPPPFGLTPSELPGAIAGQDYGPVTIKGENGTEAYLYRTNALDGISKLRDLYPWLEIAANASGITLSGRPLKPGFAQLAASALDGIGRSATRNYTIPISCPVDQFSLLGECICQDGKVKDEEKNICVEAVEIALAPDTLDPGHVCSPYSAQFRAEGGTAPYSYVLLDDQIPADLGIALNADGLLSGTPTSTATLPFPLTVIDHKGNYGAKLYQLRIDPPQIVVVADELPVGTVGIEYDVSLSATGGAAKFKIIPDENTRGWLRVAEDGTLSGRPPEPGTYTFAATAESENQISCEQKFSFTVSAPNCASGMLSDAEGQCICKPSLVPNKDGSAGCSSCGADEINFGGTCQKKVKPKDKVVTTTSSCVAPFVPLKPSGCGCPVGKQQEGNDCVDKTETPTTPKTKTTPPKAAKFSCPANSQMFKKGAGGENLRTVATNPTGQNECKTCGDGWELFNSEPPSSMRRFPVQNAKGANVFWCGQGPANPTPTPLPKQNTFTPECPGVSEWNGQSCICNPTVAQIVVCAASNGAFEQFNCTCQPGQQPQFFPPNPPTDFFDPNFGGDGPDETYDNNEACMSACYKNSEGIGSDEYQYCIQGCQ